MDEFICMLPELPKPRPISYQIKKISNLDLDREQDTVISVENKEVNGKNEDLMDIDGPEEEYDEKTKKRFELGEKIVDIIATKKGEELARSWIYESTGSKVFENELDIYKVINNILFNFTHNIKN